MSAKDDGGAAFPIQHSNEPGCLEGEAGMSLRDWFAGQALAGLLANERIDAPTDDIAGDAYAYAVAMLVERKKDGADR